MKVNTIVTRLEHLAASNDISDSCRSAVIRAARIIAEAADKQLLTATGRPRNILGHLPLTRDGCIIGHRAKVFGFYDDGSPGWSGFSSVQVDVDEWNRVPGGSYSSMKAVDAEFKKRGAKS